MGNSEQMSLLFFIKRYYPNEIHIGLSFMPNEACKPIKLLYCCSWYEDFKIKTMIYKHFYLLTLSSIFVFFSILFHILETRRNNRRD